MKNINLKTILLFFFQIPSIFFIELIFGNWLKNKPAVYNIPGALYSTNIEINPSKEWSSFTESIITYKRDELGYRGWQTKVFNDLTIPLIITIGGSDVDQRFVSEENTFSEVMEYKLKEKGLENIDVINAGVDGHSSYGQNFSIRNWHSKSLQEYKRSIKAIVFYAGDDWKLLTNPIEDNSLGSKFKHSLKNNSFFIKNLIKIKKTFFSKNTKIIESSEGKKVFLEGYDKTRDWDFSDYFYIEKKDIQFSDKSSKRYLLKFKSFIKNASNSFPYSEIIYIQQYLPGCTFDDKGNIISRLPPIEQYRNYCNVRFKIYEIQAKAIKELNNESKKKIYLDSMYRKAKISDKGYYDEGHPVGISSKEIGIYLANYIYPIIKKNF